MTVEEKEAYLLKASYTAKDVMCILGCKSTWASKVMRDCKTKYAGAIRGRSAISAKSLWLWLGTSLEEELRLLSIAKGYEKLHP